MKIIIETIPHQTQRYPTCGDWYFEEPDTLRIKVSALSDWKREALIAVHELVEVLICKKDGVSQDSVDAFDREFEAERAKGHLIDPLAEPGDEPSAPYVRQHCIATGIERILAAALDVSWQDYENELTQLP